MVLGILSVMVIMAVAFAISMRTERVAAGNYADSVRARQLVQVGLARALDDLAVNLGPTGLYQPDGRAYPPWDVTNSYIISYTNTSTNKLYLLTGAATNFVPRALWAAATNADYLNASNHWLPVDSIISNNGVVAESNRMGRVKYLILNCSGLLDANFAGSVGSTRGVGTNPAELAIGNMPEFTPAGAAAFLTRRDVGPPPDPPDYRYETLEELAALNSTDFNPSNLTVYSHALPGYWSNNVTPFLSQVVTQVNLSGTASNIYDRRVQITDALMSIDISSPDAFIIWRNLMDYIDSDSIHTDSYASVESVPMINEIVVSNVVTAVGGGSNRMDTTIYFELWYPFVRDSAENFDLQYKAAFTDLTAPLSGFAPANVVVWKSLLPNVATPGAQSFAVRSDSLPAITQVAGAVDFMSTITARVVLVVGGAAVDQVNGINIRNINTLPPPSSVSVIGSECLDPRFNWYLTQWRQTSVVTLSNRNDWTASYLLTNYDGDTNTEMYVANTSLHSVAELGYLVYSSNAPWHTVKLYGTNLHRVLDVFGLSTNTGDVFMTNTVYRGLVNCNPNVATDATAVVFAGMPVDQYPDEGSSPLPMPDARAFVSRLFARGICTNLSDIGYNLNSADFQFPAGINELQRESYFRNAFNLLNVRQNLFTIIIEAQVASGGNIPRNPVRQRAVALVWRDPYTGEMFVRSIKWLRD